MKKPTMGKKVLWPLVAGILFGGLAATGIFWSDGDRQRAALTKEILRSQARRQEVVEKKTRQQEGQRTDCPGDGVKSTRCSWCYMKVDDKGWTATPINDVSKLKERIISTGKELTIPVFPTVYEPSDFDKIFNDAILQSDIQKGDKVLVIGAGSGSDAWVAWLKSQSLVYVVEINPIGVANVNTTARLGNFPVKAMVGDIRDFEFPEDFKDFDFVLWNMPFMSVNDVKIEDRHFHFGDDGSILKSFLKLLPSVLKKGGKVIIYNSAFALEYIRYPNLVTKGDGRILVYIFSIDGT